MSRTTDARDTSKSSHSWSPWIVIIIISPVIYVLSIGPAVLLAKHFPSLFWFLVTLYYPLDGFLKSDAGRFLRPYVVAYVEWWR